MKLLYGIESGEWKPREKKSIPINKMTYREFVKKHMSGKKFNSPQEVRDEMKKIATMWKTSAPTAEKPKKTRGKGMSSMSGPVNALPSNMECAPNSMYMVNGEIHCKYIPRGGAGPVYKKSDLGEGMVAVATPNKVIREPKMKVTNLSRSKILTPKRYTTLKKATKKSMAEPANMSGNPELSNIGQTDMNANLI